MGDLRKLSAAAAPGPWAYRPDKYDDWGMIRAARRDLGSIGYGGPPVAHAASLWDEDEDDHRRARTDPCEANGRFIVELVNAYRSGRLVENDSQQGSDEDG
jgi:hypothetical protein